MRSARHRGSRWCPARGARGFTLLELLVAISILAIIAVVSWRGIASLITTRERLAPLGDKVHSELAGFGQLEIDLARAPTNAALFALANPAVRVFTIDGHTALQVLRLCSSPDGSPAAAAQTVLYQVHAGDLVRQSTAPQRLLATGTTFPDAGVVLVPGIDTLQVRVWQANNGWITPSTDADTINTVGVEVILVRRDGTRLRGVFPVG